MCVSGCATFKESRTAVATSPMPSGVVKTVAELRDVLTYILSDNPIPP